MLLGSLLVPLGFSVEVGHPSRLPAGEAWLGQLPVARRVLERLYQLLALLRRLRDPNLSPRAARALLGRGAFADALAWLEIHGNDPDAVSRWRALVEELRSHEALPAPPAFIPVRRRRRRSRRPVVKS